MVANMVQGGLWGWPDGLPARRETGKLGHTNLKWSSWFKNIVDVYCRLRMS